MATKPVAPKNSAVAKEPALDQTLAKQLMSHVNGCADDVFEHNIRILSMRQEEGNVFKGMLENKTLDTGPTSFSIHWPRSLKTKDDISELQMYIINCIADDYSESDDSDE